MTELTGEPIEAGRIFQKLSQKGAGSVVVHFGVVKPSVEGRKTRGILFEERGDLAGEMKALEEKLRKDYDLIDVVLVRRTGELRVGDIILAAAVSAVGRDAAFGACREAVESFKKMENIGKRELYED